MDKNDKKLCILLFNFEYFSEFVGVSIGHDPFVRGLIRDDVPAQF